MNLRDLQYVVTIADEGHFGKAALLCHVSQSTLSIQVKKLEDYLGVQLFERTNKHVMLTAAGRKICDHARLVLQQAENIRQIAKDAHDPLSGEIRFGAFPTLAPYLFPLCTHPIKQLLPNITLQLIEEKTGPLLDMLDAGHMDCALIAAPVTRQGITSMPVFHEPFFLAVPASHPLAQKKFISDMELTKLVLLLLDEGHCLRSQALEICHSIGTGEARQFRATSLETLRQMVAMGDAITLIPKLAVRDDNPAIRYIPLRNSAFGRTITLCWRETSARTALFEKLAQGIRNSLIKHPAHTRASL